MSRYDDVWLVIPAYNEGPVIADVVKQARTTFPNIVVVDDGSTDHCARAILDTGAHLLRHPVNLGQGAALQTGLDYVLAQPDARYIATFDADGQHQTHDVERMVKLLRSGAVDVVLGSRFIGRNGAVPWTKRFVLRTVAIASPSSRRLRLTDAHNGLRVLNREAASRLRITMNGIAHASEIVGFLAASDLRVTEMPVEILYTSYSRSKGQSLMNGFNVIFDLCVRERQH